MIYSATRKVAGRVPADTFTQASLGLAGRLLFTNLRVFAALDRVIRYRSLNRLQIRVGNLIKPEVAGEGRTVQELVDTNATVSHAEFVKIVDSLVAFPRSGTVAFSRIGVSTLILYGENEPSLIRDHATLIGELIPTTVAVTEIPSAGHASNIDKLMFFTEGLREFTDNRAYSN